VLSGDLDFAGRNPKQRLASTTKRVTPETLHAHDGDTARHPKARRALLARPVRTIHGSA
jgi:hypothetical protein